MSKKKTLIVVSIAFVIVIATLFVSYGFITSIISGNETSKNTVFNGQMIKVEYSDGTETLSSNQGAFTPGSTITKTFTIKNTGNISVKYSINLDNITNTFTRKSDITYELSSNDTILKNGMYDAKGVFPDNKLTILNKDVLNRGESKMYTLKINYLNSKENQIIDSGKNLSAKILIDESTISINKLIVYGNSVQNGTPTPETPIEVESVGERTKNILPINANETFSINDLDLIIENDLLTLNGSIDKNTQFGLYLENGTLKFINGVIGMDRDSSNLMSLKAGTYTMTLKYLGGTIKRESGSNNGGYIGLYTYRNGVKLFDQRKTFSMSDYSFTFTTNEDSDIQFFVLQFIGLNNKATFDNYKIKIQLEESASATEYEPYGYKIPIKVNGKNLLTNTNNTRVGDNTKISDEGRYYDVQTSVNTGGMGWYVDYDFNVGDRISAQAKVEYVSTAELKDSVTLRIWNETQKKWIHEGANGITSSFSTITVGETKVLKFDGVTLTSNNYSKGDLIELRITRGMQTGSSGNNLINFKIFKETVMVEKSNISTDYEPYVEPKTYNIYLEEPLRAVGEYKDSIDFENNLLKRQVGKHIITGNEKWIIYSGSNPNTFYLLDTLDAIYDENSKVLSSHYIGQVSGGGNAYGSGNAWLQSVDTYRRLYINDQNYSDVTSFKSHLLNQYNLNNPVLIYYPLLNEDSKNIELPEIQTIKGVTNTIEICSDNGVCASNIEVEYDE